MSDTGMPESGQREEATPDDSPRVYYQVGLDLLGRACLVVGGGSVARRKVNGLMEAGAAVTVVAPECEPMQPGVTVKQRPFRDDDLDAVEFAIAASDDRELNNRVSCLAQKRHIWVNVADDPHASTVILPATLRRGTLHVAVSTGGASPALAHRLRDLLDDALASEYADLVDLLGALRREWTPRAIAAGVPPAVRHAAWESVLDLPLLDLLVTGRNVEARSRAQRVLDTALSAAGH